MKNTVAIESGWTAFKRGGWLSAGLAFIALGVAVLTLEAAAWISPQPSFLLTVGIAVACGTIIGLTRLNALFSSLLIVIVGAAVMVWQALGLFPAIEGLSSWSRFTDALARPNENSVAFIVFLIAVSWLAGGFGAWLAVKHKNGWPAFITGGLIVILNLINLPREMSYSLPLYLAAGLSLVIQTGLRRRSAGKRAIPVIVAPAMCLVIIAVAFVLPQAPAGYLKIDIDGGMLYKSIKTSALNIFNSVPSKVKTVRAASQDSVSFSSPPDQSEAVRFTISPALTGYYRTRYFDTYAATGWANRPLADRELAAEQKIIDAVPLGRSVVIRYQVENAIKTDLILLNGQPSALSIEAICRGLPGPEGEQVMALIATRLLSPYQRYNVTAGLSSATAAELAAAGADYPAWLTEQYLQLPANLPSSVKLLARQITRSLTYGGSPTTSSYAKVVAIKNYLQGLTYNINGAGVPSGADGVAAFLASRQGNCVNFASALVVMLRASGVPARYCQGYLGSELGEDGKNVIIRGKDSHAWAEVYFPNYGWIVVEATPGRPADSFQSAAPVTPGETADPTTTAPQVIPGAEIEETDTPASSGGILGTDLITAQLPLLILLIIPALALALGGGGYYLTVARTPGAAYARLQLIGRSFKTGQKAAETPAEYARRLGRLLPEEAPGIGAVAARYASARYGPRAARDASSTEMSRQWRDLSRRLIKRRLGLA